MKITDTHDPEVWEARSSGHVGLFFFGLPFLLAGLFVMTTPLGLVPMEGDSPPWYVVVPFGAVFALAGLGMMTGRSGVIIDRRRDRLVKWYGLLIPLVRREHRLGLFDRLSLTREARRSDDSTRIVYPVRLEGIYQEKTICIHEPPDYQQARATAESLAGFLRLPLADRSSGEEVLREPERLNESIRERARRTGEEIPRGVEPAGMRSTLREESGTLHIRVPPTGLTTAHRLEIVGVLAFVTVAALVAMPGMDLDGQDPMRFVFPGLIVLGFVLVPLLSVLSHVLVQARRWCAVQVSPALLRVECGNKVTEIFADELEELTLAESALPAGVVKGPEGRLMIDGNFGRQGPRGGRFPSADPGGMTPAGPVVSYLLSAFLKENGSAGIAARSDKTSVRFGRGLSREELQYLYARIKQVLAA